MSNDKENKDILDALGGVMHGKKTLYIMVGNIGSGKTTYIKNHLPKAISISKDGIRYSLSPNGYVFDRNIEPIIHNTTVFMAHSFCKQNLQELVLDETCMRAKSRKTFIEVAKVYEYKVVAIVMPKLSKEVAVARRMVNPHQQDNSSLWEGVWDKFDKSYQEVTKEEGFDEIRKITVDQIGA